ncbi:hypothetical protein EUGRSUZ_G00846 [Eucalyptus grandis]|uniref:Uncharacterized protein n=2 Tax=Eucalyptus grandis TaxID=71139 RepID=A0ACC3K1Y8_EUCGR|nr:hypothetical protein EUGRSUZ_G00846 [Eucalyptus grandis]
MLVVSCICNPLQRIYWPCSPEHLVFLCEIRALSTLLRKVESSIDLKYGNFVMQILICVYISYRTRLRL